jgi:hypothetical protein
MKNKAKSVKLKAQNCKLKFKTILILLTLFVFLIPVLTLAVSAEYSSSPPTGKKGEPPPFAGGKGSYSHWLFPIMLSAAGILAVLMIVIGGMEYIGAAATGNPQNIGNARQKIINAILGLLLAFGAWLILYTINPDLVKLELNVPPICDNIKYRCVNNDSGEIIGIDFDTLNECKSYAKADDDFCSCESFCRVDD